MSCGTSGREARTQERAVPVDPSIEAKETGAEDEEVPQAAADAAAAAVQQHVEAKEEGIGGKAAGQEAGDAEGASNDTGGTENVPLKHKAHPTAATAAGPAVPKAEEVSMDFNPAASTGTNTSVSPTREVRRSKRVREGEEAGPKKVQREGAGELKKECGKARQAEEGDTEGLGETKFRKSGGRQRGSLAAPPSSSSASDSGGQLVTPGCYAHALWLCVL